MTPFQQQAEEIVDDYLNCRLEGIAGLKEAIASALQKQTEEVVRELREAIEEERKRPYLKDHLDVQSWFSVAVSCVDSAASRILGEK